MTDLRAPTSAIPSLLHPGLLSDGETKSGHLPLHTGQQLPGVVWRSHRGQLSSGQAWRVQSHVISYCDHRKHNMEKTADLVGFWGQSWGQGACRR